MTTLEEYVKDTNAIAININCESILVGSERWDQIKHTKISDNLMRCECEDKACYRLGDEGEVSGHVENCPCKKCHDYFSKI